MKFFFSPIGMYTSSAHLDLVIHARCAHSKLKLDDDIKNTCIDIVQWLYSMKKILPFFRFLEPLETVCAAWYRKAHY